MDGRPTPEMLEAFAAMDRFTEELVKAGVFVAAAGFKEPTRNALSRALAVSVADMRGRLRLPALNSDSTRKSVG